MDRKMQLTHRQGCADFSRDGTHNARGCRIKQSSCDHPPALPRLQLHTCTCYSTTISSLSSVFPLSSICPPQDLSNPDSNTAYLPLNTCRRIPCTAACSFYPDVQQIILLPSLLSLVPAVFFSVAGVFSMASKCCGIPQVLLAFPLPTQAAAHTQSYYSSAA